MTLLAVAVVLHAFLMVVGPYLVHKIMLKEQKAAEPAKESKKQTFGIRNE